MDDRQAASVGYRVESDEDKKNRAIVSKGRQISSSDLARVALEREILAQLRAEGRIKTSLPAKQKKQRKAVVRRVKPAPRGREERLRRKWAAQAACSKEVMEKYGPKSE